ncbi:deoxyribonuclease V [Aphanothece hegewaldii CCALA 016]|uniref:Endonuclease V n=1 Tax=Aphanothece hegewaldii CCALA 016 TaxID=2107694 RepID=A0A2T1M3E8_9CHRO|nr:deoxyribonuclease V [Aphanothece hegewaldii]PSF39355.1 deoxyribonuclease V [Aphanothece hegewaldii CCALA 016]
MKIPNDYQSPKTLEEAKAIQQNLRSQVIITDQLEPVQLVAGVDVGFEDNYALTRAAVAVLRFPELELVETAIAILPTCFPYIPGFLSFREIPAIIEALKKITIVPHLILCDGQGIAHPLRLGIASHLGVLIDCPTIGVAKSRLIGSHEEVNLEKGSQQPLIDQGETIGIVLRTKYKVKPLYISPGHRISLPTAIQYVLKSTTKYRLPETTRIADRLSKGRI